MTAAAGLEVAVTADVGDLALDLRFDVAAPATVAVLGPNGAGKTTLLRLLAGLHPVRTGSVRLDGDVLDDPAARVHVSAERRPVGFVFQDHLLFPHLSVRDNVAFGLRCRGVGRQEAHREAASWIARVGLAGREGDRPATLSGGQSQRVALARALAIRPRLLLLDEPMAALDATTRATTRRDLLDVLAVHDGVRVVVTHDPLEAMALADDLIVLEAGRIVQRGSPAQLVAEPRSAYVADLVGVNRLDATAGTAGHLTVDGHPAVALAAAAATALVGPVSAVFHPRAVSLHRAAPEGSARNVWAGEALTVDRSHDRVRVRVDIAAAGPSGRPLVIVAEVTPAAAEDLALQRGGPIWASVKATEVSVFPR